MVLRTHPHGCSHVKSATALLDHTATSAQRHRPCQLPAGFHGEPRIWHTTVRSQRRVQCIRLHVTHVHCRRHSAHVLYRILLKHACPMLPTTPCYSIQKPTRTLLSNDAAASGPLAPLEASSTIPPREGRTTSHSLHVPSRPVEANSVGSVGWKLPLTTHDVCPVNTATS